MLGWGDGCTARCCQSAVSCWKYAFEGMWKRVQKSVALGLQFPSAEKSNRGPHEGCRQAKGTTEQFQQWPGQKYVQLQQLEGLSEIENMEAASADHFFKEFDDMRKVRDSRFR